jgi:hypothetical protein
MCAFLFTHSIQLSYGDCQGRAEWQWQNRLKDDHPEELCKTIEGYGFSALVLYRQALKPARLAHWDSWSRPPDYKSPSGLIWVYHLHPAEQPTLPPVTPQVTLDNSTFSWEHNAKHRWLWADGSAQLDVTMPSEKSTAEHHLSFSLNSFGEPRKIRVLVGGQEKGTYQAECGYENFTPVDLDLTQSLQPGINHIRVLSSGHPTRNPEGGGWLSFQIADLKLDGEDFPPTVEEEKLKGE